jgi:DNA-directed RNA polymerase subunit K/omega
VSDTPFSVCRPSRVGAFEFVVVSTLRAAQLMRGCTPKVECGTHKHTVVAQHEVATGRVARIAAETLTIL